jgi:hypothetical protein
MRTFYVRPQSDAGYGRGDGASYENAWNGLKSVDWQALAGVPATLWVCGRPDSMTEGFVTMHVEWSYLKSHGVPARPHTRRESTVAV